MSVAVLSATLLVNMRVAIHVRIVCVRIVMRGIVWWTVVLFDHGVSVIGLAWIGCIVAVHSIVRTVAMTGEGVC